MLYKSLVMIKPTDERAEFFRNDLLFIVLDNELKAKQ